MLTTQSYSPQFCADGADRTTHQHKDTAKLTYAVKQHVWRIRGIDEPNKVSVTLNTEFDTFRPIVIQIGYQLHRSIKCSPSWF